jgi:hypothetical protein
MRKLRREITIRELRRVTFDRVPLHRAYVSCQKKAAGRKRILDTQ